MEVSVTVCYLESDGNKKFKDKTGNLNRYLVIINNCLLFLTV